MVISSKQFVWKVFNYSRSPPQNTSFQDSWQATSITMFVKKMNQLITPFLTKKHQSDKPLMHLLKTLNLCGKLTGSIKAKICTILSNISQTTTFCHLKLCSSWKYQNVCLARYITEQNLKLFSMPFLLVPTLRFVHSETKITPKIYDLLNHAIESVQIVRNKTDVLHALLFTMDYKRTCFLLFTLHLIENMKSWKQWY